MKYRSAPGMDDEIVRQVLRAYIKKVGFIKNTPPISVEPLEDEWRARCLATPDLQQALGEYCGAEFFVAHRYALGRYKNSDQRFVLKICDAGKCEFQVSGDFAPEE